MSDTQPDDQSGPESANIEQAGPPEVQLSQAEVAPPPPPSPAERRAVLVDVALVIAVYFLPLTCVAIQGWHFPAKPIPLVWSETALSVQAVGYAALGLYLIARSGLPPAVFGLTRPRFTDLLFGGLIWVVMLFVLWLYATYGPTNVFGGTDRPSDQIWLPPHTVIDYTLVVLAACLNGFGEEVMVRGFFQTRLEQLTQSPVWSVVISTLLFTAYHAYYGPNGMIDVFLVGLLFGVCFRLTKRLWIVVVAHALQDLISMVQLGT